MHGLDVKYWGKPFLTRITGIVGNPLKANKATMLKERLNFARIIVEMPHPAKVMFENEIGQIVEQKIVYEWKQ